MPKDNPGPQGAAFVSIDDTDASNLQHKADELDAQIRELEGRLAAQTQEIETLRATACGLGKDALDFRARHVKADSEIASLKGEIHRKDLKITELEEAEISSQTKHSGLAADLSKRDAQGLSLSRRSEAHSAERIKLDREVSVTRDWVYQTTAKLAITLADLEKALDAQTNLQHRLDAARANAARATPLEQTVMALRARLAAYESSEGGKSPSDKPATAV